MPNPLPGAFFSQWFNGLPVDDVAFAGKTHAIERRPPESTAIKNGKARFVPERICLENMT
jgi:hypothetical protein